MRVRCRNEKLSGKRFFIIFSFLRTFGDCCSHLPERFQKSSLLMVDNKIQETYNKLKDEIIIGIAGFSILHCLSVLSFVIAYLEIYVIFLRFPEKICE